ncbi:hypothetical protein ACYPKM_02380 [Pseudomonas aeruginosa]
MTSFPNAPDFTNSSSTRFQTLPLGRRMALNRESHIAEVFHHKAHLDFLHRCIAFIVSRNGGVIRRAKLEQRLVRAAMLRISNSSTLLIKDTPFLREGVVLLRNLDVYLPNPIDLPSYLTLNNGWWDVSDDYRGDMRKVIEESLPISARHALMQACCMEKAELIPVKGSDITFSDALFFLELPIPRISGGINQALDEFLDSHVTSYWLANSPETEPDLQA